MVQASQGFILTRHWHDTPAGLQIDLWLATDGGPVLVSLPPQQAVAFIPAQQQARTEVLLNTDTSVTRKQRPPRCAL